jgi:hypothetical protein
MPDSRKLLTESRSWVALRGAGSETRLHAANGPALVFLVTA